MLNFIAGAALALCLPKPGLCFLAWLAPAVLFVSLRRAKTDAESAAKAAVFGFAFFSVALHWVYQTCRFALVPVPVAVLAWAALSGLLALSWTLHGAVFHRQARRLPEAAVPWAAAALWAAMESALSRWAPRLGIIPLGYTQWRNLAVLQGSSVFGPYALGFLVMLWNSAAAEFFLKKGPPQRRNFTAAAALVACWTGFGAAVLIGRPALDPGPSVEILQPNIDQYQKWDERFEAGIRRTLDDLMARPRAAEPALVLWPESAVPGWLDERGNLDWVSGWAKRRNAPLLAGAVTSEGKRNYNSAVLLDGSGKPVGVYHKRELVPFGEFVPLRRLFQGWIGILASMGDFDAGALEQPLMGFKLGPLAPSICYEAVFPRLARIDAGRGARVLANLTNDGWYKETWGPHQHFYTNMFRAVENRVYVLRAANTGISGIIDPYGVVLARTELNKPDRLDVRLPSRDPFPRGSFYARHGDWFGGLCLLAAVGLLLLPKYLKL